jgi:hypothetical protein
MADSRISLESLPEEYISELEYQAGLPGGTFEAFYNKIQEESIYGTEMDALKMEKLKADIARTHQLARGGSSGSGGTQPSHKFSKDDISTLVGAGMNASQIAILQEGINQFGLSAMMDTLPPEHSKVISSLFKEDDPKYPTPSNKDREMLSLVYSSIAGGDSDEDVKELAMLQGYVWDEVVAFNKGKDPLSEITRTSSADDKQGWLSRKMGELKSFYGFGK